jgi:hypothetical protein
LGRATHSRGSFGEAATNRLNVVAGYAAAQREPRQNEFAASGTQRAVVVQIEFAFTQLSAVSGFG